MITRSKSGAKHILMMTEFDQDPSEPTNVDEALKRPEWVTSMKDELEALDRNETWELVHRPLDMNVVGSRWVFKTKLKPNGSIDRFKARLVLRGTIKRKE